MKISAGKIFVSMILAFVTASLFGCASSLMRPGQAQASAPPEDRARIVFMRSSAVLGAIGVDLFDVSNGELKLVGQIPNGNQIIYETTPGEKIFMAYGTAADFMTADVAGGKTYYVILRPNWGTGGFAPTPVRSDGSTDSNMKSPDFMQWVTGTSVIEPNEKADAWFAENKEKLQKTYQEYWEKFQRKTDSEKAQRRLRPEDGVSVPFKK